MDKKIRPGLLAFTVAIPLCVGGISAMLTEDMMKEYASLPKPALSPPAWLFPLVWTLLYIMMGIASYLVLRSEAELEDISKALRFYGLQLLLNFFWSILFFSGKLYLLAFAELLVMWGLLIAAAVQFFRIHKTAGLLLIPCAAWTGFAAYLNFAVYRLNLLQLAG